MKRLVLVFSIILITTLGHTALSYAEQKCITDGLFPDTECTPGDVFPDCTIEQMCVRGYSATVRNMPKSKKLKVYEMYEIPKDQQKNYVIDHLISLQLCGNNEIKNLFPQIREGEFNSRTKDKIENFLKREICKGNIELEDAQTVISEDWLSVYTHMRELE